MSHHTLSPRQETEISQAVREALAEARKRALSCRIDDEFEFERDMRVGELVDEIKRVLRVEN